VNDPVDAAHATSDELRIRDGTDVGREGGGEKVDPPDLVLALSKSPNESFAEMPGASCYEDTHARAITFLPFNGPGAQLRGTGRRRSLEHLGLMPEGYQASIGTRCAICGAVSWLAYFAALKVANAGPVAALDRLSLPLVFILGAALLGEPVGWRGWLSVALAVGGTYLIVWDQISRAAV
jgi:hypothetical protein